METHDKILIGMLVAIATSISALVGKIVWDWLKERRQGGMDNVRCPEHDTCVIRIDRCETCVQEVQRVQGELKTLFDERTGSIQTELTKGSQKFDSLTGDIGEIKESISALVAVAEERAKMFRKEKD